MFVYVVTSVISICVAFLAARVKKGKLGIAWLSAIPLFLVAALRTWTGTDYATYYYNQSQEILNGNSQHLEIAFRGIILLAYNVFSSYQVAIAIFAFVTIFLSWKYFLKESNNISFMIFVFISLGCFYFSLNAMRQAVAIAIFCYATRFIKERKFKEYVLIIFFGVTIHYSAVLYLPLYFVLNKKISTKNLLMISVIIFFFSSFLAKYIYPLFLGKYMAYFNWGSSSSYNFRYFIPLTFVLGLYLVYLKKNKLNSFFETENAIHKNLTIFAFWGCLLAPTLTGESSSRAIAFFLPGVCVFWNSLYKISRKEIKILSVLLGVVIFSYISMKNPGWILPYHSIFDDYKMSYTEFIYKIYSNR